MKGFAALPFGEAQLARARQRIGALGAMLAPWFWPAHQPPVLSSIESRDNNYTAMRFGLAALVVYYHAFALTDDASYRMDPITRILLPTPSLGDLAIGSFFFLSGLFVSQSYLNDPKVLHFVAKRFLRIWPGLFVCVALTAAISVLLSQPAQFWRYLLFPDFYKHIVFNSTLRFEWTLDGVWEGRRFSSLNGSIHTLDAGARMYAILAVAALCGAIVSRRRMAIFGVGAVALTTLLHGSGLLDEVWAYADDGWIPATLFFAGVAACGVAPFLKISWAQGAALFVLTVTNHGVTHLCALYLFMIWSLLFFGQFHGLRRFLRPRADLSYGVYIYGWPATQFVVQLTSPHINPYGLTALSLPLSMVFAAASWRFVEAPAVALGHTLAKANFGFYALRRSPAWRRFNHDGKRLVAVTALFAVCVLAAGALTWHEFSPVAEMSVHIVGYGPETGRAGRGINQQPDGKSAIWLNLDGAPEDGVTYVYVEGRRMATSLRANSATAAIDADVLAERGDKRVYLETVHFDRRLRSNSVWLHITK